MMNPGQLLQNMIRKLIFIGFWFYLWVAPLSAQYQIDFNVLTVDEGLSQNLVNTMFTDSRGFLWIGTNDGLNRYDGFENRVFRRIASDSTTIASNMILSLAETNDNRIIVGHSFGHISIWDPAKAQFRRYTNHVKSIPLNNNDGINTISVSDAGDIYALMDTQLFTYNASLDQFEYLPLNNELQNLRAVYPEADSTLLLFTFDRIVYRHHLATGHTEMLSGMNASTFGLALGFTSLGTNRYAFTVNNYLYVYDAQQEQIIYSIIIPDFVTTITLEESRIWIAGADFSLHYWNPNEPERSPVLVTPQTDSFRAAVPQIRAMQFSQDGVLWIGTIGYGLSRLYDTTYWFGHLRSDVNSASAIMNTSIRAIYPYSIHEVLIGGYSGLELYDFQRMQSRPILGGDSGNPIYVPFSMVPDQQQESVFWIGTEGSGLLKLDLDTGVYEQFLLDSGRYVSNLVHGLGWISDTLLLLATSSGFHVFDTVNLRESVPSALMAYARETMNFIVSFRENEFFSGTSDGTLVRALVYNDELIVDEVLSDELRLARLLSMTQDVNGHYWLATSDGVIWLDAEFNIVQHLTTESGLPNNMVYSAQFDNLGFLWMSTNLGVSRLDTRTSTFKNFTARDGLQSNEFNRKAYGNYQGSIMYLGGIHGVNFFSPEQIISDLRTHNVLIETLSAPSGTYRFGSSDMIQLPYTDTQVNIRYTSPVFHNPRATESWYRLANIDTTWRVNPLQNELILAGLQPGTYRLQLVRSSAANIHQAPVTEVLFNIRPPFYLLWYVQLGTFLIVVGLIGFSVNSYLQKLRNTIDMSRKYSRQLMLFQDEERRRVAEALHDSIGSKLMLVKLSFRQVLMTVKDEFAEQKYQEINTIISDTVTEIREISQNIHPHLLEKIGISKSIEALLESLQKMAQVTFTWRIDPIDDLLTAEEALLFYRFVQESITNVIKHSKAKHCYVMIEIDHEKGVILTEIRDNGIGIHNLNWSEPSKTMGLRSFEERAAHLQALFSIEDAPDGGTIVKLQKPISG